MPARPAPPARRPASRLARPLRLLARGLDGLAYPTLCLGCESRLGSAADALCPSCLRALPPADVGAAQALVAGAPVGRAVAVWAFDPGGAVQRVQHALKYGGRPSLGRGLGRLVGAVARREGLAPDAVVPVPLSNARRLERGYNQAAALAEGAAEALGVPVLDALARRRPTRKQARLSKRERRRNVDGAFALGDGALVARLRVLLVDDVATTGATLAAAARPLAEAGASVDVATLALAGA